jgi:ABC-type glycerol-3-phosphate transport system permease component
VHTSARTVLLWGGETTVTVRKSGKGGRNQELAIGALVLIPVLQMFTAAGIYGSFLGIWLAHTGFGLPLAIFLLYNFMSQLPGDLFETASIDGATHFQMFTKVVLPLSVPALAAFAIFQFLWVWNDLLVALVFSVRARRLC